MSKKNSLNLIEHARPSGVISPNKQILPCDSLSLISIQVRSSRAGERDSNRCIDSLLLRGRTHTCLLGNTSFVNYLLTLTVEIAKFCLAENRSLPDSEIKNCI